MFTARAVLILRRARGESGPLRRLTRPPMSESLIVDLILQYSFRMVTVGVAEKRTSKAI
jgi:hypothetical protein